ncbi:MAG: ClpXP protease specificity-enhancing factor [Sedimenticolaceae bacterium]|uniref:ClpXP protease specificity-enhancing factor n=1 Tax=Candidatus Vondammii sp. HM_W22 TaxID=2687299 RepID=UPI001F135817|nr:ClpXP protease specificity-enhancing factor [Candidatus Vondammii sp. HM_W22]
MSSNRPYLIRALYEWLVDNGLTPHLLVEAEGAGVVVPTQYAEDGRIVLNIGLSAVHDLELGNDYITFNARFGGSPMVVIVPPSAVLRIYARENGRGMLFPDEEYQDGDETPPDNDPEPMLPKERPKLKVVK